jgi:hypothetical protein
MHNRDAGGKSRRIDTYRIPETEQEEKKGVCKLLTNEKVVPWLAVRN